jgi:hypothetical protein
MATRVVDESPAYAGGLAGLTVPLPPALNGDFVYVQVMLYAPNSTANVGMIDMDRPVDVVCQDSVSEGAVVVGWHFVVAAVFDPGDFHAGDNFITLTWPTNAVITNAVFVARTYTLRDAVGAPSDATCVMAGPYTTAAQPTGGLALAADVDLVIDTVVSTGTGSSGEPPADFTPGVRASVPSGAAAWFQLWQRPGSAGVFEAPRETQIAVPTTPAGDTGVYWIATISFVSQPVLVVPGLPEPQRLALDCADQYTVLITSSDYRNVINSVGWSSIEWTRVLDEVSTATVLIPDSLGGVRCCADVGGLLPWRYGIMIERNDQPVWSGPVTGLNRQGEALQVTASDVMARFQKRLATRRDLNFTNRDSGRVFADLIDEVQFDSDPWRFTAPRGVTGEVLTRKVLALEFENSLDVLNDIANSSVDYFVMNGSLFVHDTFNGWVYNDGTEDVILRGPYTSSMELLYGLFTEDSWAQRPDWSISGQEQGNAVWVSAPDSGIEGSRRFWVAQDFESQAFDGVLDLVDDNPLYRPAEGEIIPDSVFQFGAQSTLALRRIAPAVIEGGALAVGAPIDVPNLRPGSLWACDIYDACFGQLLQMARLKRVQVKVAVADSGITETVAPILTPRGSRD